MFNLFGCLLQKDYDLKVKADMVIRLMEKGYRVKVLTSCLTPFPFLLEESFSTMLRDSSSSWKMIRMLLSVFEISFKVYEENQISWFIQNLKLRELENIKSCLFLIR